MLARRLLTPVLGTTLLAATFFAIAPASAERSKLTPSGWAWHTGDHSTPEFITDQINRNNLRLIDLEVPFKTGGVPGPTRQRLSTGT